MGEKSPKPPGTPPGNLPGGLGDFSPFKIEII